MEILCYFAGVLAFYSPSAYPVIFLISGCYFHPRPLYLLCFLAGLSWGWFHQQQVATHGMPKVDIIQKAEGEGKIVAIIKKEPQKTQLLMVLHSLNHQQVQAQVSFSCYLHCPDFKLNQTWRFQAKLYKPRNLQNPGRFDYQGNLRAHHIEWLGIINPGQSHLVSSQHAGFSLRERVAKTLENTIVDPSVLSIVQALTIGLTTHISSAQWDLFRRTGTTHLLVISGAHISLLAGLIHGIVLQLWVRFPRLCLKIPAKVVGGVGGLVMGALYACLAGLGIPTQRALIAYAFLIAPLFFKRIFASWQAWRYGLFAVLTIEPHAVCFPGFYLSFLAVALLIASSERFDLSGWKQVVVLQFCCLVGLMPFTLYWFSYGAVNGLFANLFAIPMVSYIILPLALLTSMILLIHPAPILVWPLHFCVKSLLLALHWIDKTAFLNFTFSFQNALAFVAVMVALFILFFMPIRALLPAAGLLLASALIPFYERVGFNELRIRVLDVGQGLAVVLQTARHTLIYDTGMQFFHGGDMAQLAIIPYLKTLGIKTIDALIISHPDLDHRGGLKSLEASYPVQELIVNDPSFYHRGNNCHEKADWDWDGVHFHFFALPALDKNNSSCVLQVATSTQKLLLTGDIEQAAERFLVKTVPDQLASDILVIPHHGSKTSSTQSFIAKVAPKLAIISSGFANRYHFPHQQTLDTLDEQGVKRFNTSECGMISVHLGSLAEREGFEPSIRFRIHTFQACAFNRSATSPMRARIPIN